MNPLASCYGLLQRLRHDRRGNVLMLMGFSVIPLTFATGMVIDYSRAARLQTKLNAIADSAALSAVTAPAMEESDDTKVHDEAVQMFNAQAATLGGLDGTPVVTVTLTHPDGANSRVALVSYTANSFNAFGGVLHMRSIAVGGSSTAKAVAAPDMDFYLALDTSPSMALPTTTDGISTMDAALTCSFACHSNKIGNYVQKSTVGKLPTPILDNTHFAIAKGTYAKTGSGSTQKQPIDANGAYVYVNATVTDTIDAKLMTADGKTTMRSFCQLSSSNKKNICVYNADGTYVDSYWYALNKGLQLRVTAERGAVQDLMTLATSYATTNKRTYHAGIWTFDHKSDLKTILAMPNPVTKSPANLTDASAAAAKVDLVMVNDQAGNGRPPNGESGTEYLFTSFQSILSKMSDVLPTASGHGTDTPGDTPQGYLFIITDGMSDEQSSSIGAPYSLGANRTRSEIVKAHIDQCTAIKARGFKIAILYTEYTAASIKDDEPGQRDFVTANIPDVAPALTSCASPGLMYTVKTDESISSALQTLFSKAIATARLTQ